MVDPSAGCGGGDGPRRRCRLGPADGFSDARAEGRRRVTDAHRDGAVREAEAEKEAPGGGGPGGAGASSPSTSAAGARDGSDGEEGASALSSEQGSQAALPDAPDAEGPSDIAERRAASGGSDAPVEIGIDTVGYQKELDRCLWVRMDLGATAPIVGRHNYCGGDVVLGLDPGDRVDLEGKGLDGSYVVSGTRDAHAGDNALEATRGLAAAVILQTCDYDKDAVRLVALASASGGGSSAGG